MFVADAPVTVYGEFEQILTDAAPTLAVGAVVTDTLVLILAEHPLVPVTVTVYVPAFAKVAAPLLAACVAAVNVPGPLHA